MKIIKLILISSDVNSNKVYQMTENRDGTFLAQWGRVGAKLQSQSKSMSVWDKVYREKTDKGYKDNTSLFVVENVDKTAIAGQSTVKDFLKSRTATVISIVKKLQDWAKISIQENYTVSSENVTRKQVDKAQELLNSITGIDLTKLTINKFNDSLIEFYGIVPRKMKKVLDHLVKVDDDLNALKIKIITEEQATLDVMTGQVLLNSNVTESVDEITIETDIIKLSGLEIVEVIDDAVITKIKNLMGDQKSKFKAAYEVKNVNTHLKYDMHVTGSKNTKEELFWHGSRNQNWWSIMTTGLLIRPTNVIISGKMWGEGCYFASLFKKSFGYTSGRNSYYAKGDSNEAILALYSVHVGNQKKMTSHTSECYSLNWSKISKDNYDSVHAKAGASIINDEYIIYKSQQSTIKYLVVVDA